MTPKINPRLNFTKELAEKKRRVATLPRYMEGAMYSTAKGRAKDFIKYWQRNIRTDALSVRRLKAKTVKMKAKRGYRKPSVPLYGLGDRDPHTYINMMRLYAMKNGYKVAPGRKTHHKSELKLKDLFIVHEYGCTIQNGFGRGIHIRIPARPTFFLSYESFLIKEAKKKKNRMVMNAARQYIRTGRTELFHKIRSRYGGRGTGGEEKVS